MGLALVVAAIVASTATGMAAERRFGAPAEAAARRLLWVMLFVLVPPVVYLNVARLEIDADVAGGVLAGWVALLIVAALARAAVGRDTPRPVAGAVMVGSVQGNTGYLGYPLTAVLLGADRLPEAVAYDLMVAVPVLFTLGFGIGAAYGTAVSDRLAGRVRAFLFRNPLMVAFALGLLAPAELAPEALVNISRVIVFALLPLGFFAVGVHFAADLPRGGVPGAPSRELALGLVLRLAVAPAVLLALAAPFIDLPAPYLLLAAMPCGINVLLVANTYGLDRRLAAGLIAWSTAVVLVAVAVAGVAAG